MRKILLLVALTVASIWGSETSRAKEGNGERIELQQDRRLPSPQRGRGAGGEGDHHNLIRRLPFGIQQASSAYVLHACNVAHRQLLSPVREAEGGRLRRSSSQPASQRREGFLPGARVLLDAHNCYPENGQWGDRLERALKTGLPIAIEQDLAWYTDKVSGKSWSVVVHHLPPSGTEPTLKTYFFEQIRPIVERALQDHNRKDWPVITLNLDFKSEEPEHLEFIWKLLGEYESWLCTASRTADDGRPGALELRPVLVLTGSSDAQQKVFHDAVPVGRPLALVWRCKPSEQQTNASRSSSFSQQLSTLVEQFLVCRGRRGPAKRWRLDGGRCRPLAVPRDDGPREGSLDSLLHA